MHRIEVADFTRIARADLEGIFRLRSAAFGERLKWVTPSSSGLEQDRFDAFDTHYIFARSPAGQVDACWRLLPTTGAYMLKDVFPQLLHGTTAPGEAGVWELSRFAVASGHTGSSTAAFGPLPVEMMAASVRFAHRNRIDRYLTVTTLSIERLLRARGLNMRRMGPPLRIGVAMTVACVIEIDVITARAVGL